jgi:hypothetical protein
LTVGSNPCSIARLQRQPIWTEEVAVGRAPGGTPYNSILKEFLKLQYSRKLQAQSMSKLEFWLRAELICLA